MSQQNRGQLTARIESKSQELLGYKMDRTELRLMAYVQYVMMNEHRIDPAKCNADDRHVLQRWREAGHIEGGMSRLAITKQFWDIMCEILFLGYVDLNDE